MENNTKKQIEWVRDNVLLLLELWQKFELLYNTKHELYSKKLARQDALNKICDKLKKTMPGIECGDVKNKMNYLRGQYTRELSKLKLKSGMDRDDVPECSAFWFPYMNFLKEFVKCKKRKSNFDLSESNIVEETITDFDLSIESSITSPLPLLHSKRKKIDSSRSSEDEFLNKASAALGTIADAASKRTHTLCNDPFVTNINSYTSYLNKELLAIKDESLQDELKFKINNLIYEYKKKTKRI